jgi:hypothetical protein
MKCTLVELLVVLTLAVAGQRAHSQQIISSYSSTVDGPGYTLQDLLQDDDAAGPLAPVDIQLSDGTDIVSTVFAGQAGSSCRSPPLRRPTFTLRCHSSCQVCVRVSAMTPAESRQCTCCRPGFYQAAGVASPTCGPCPQGQFAPLYGMTACRRCPRNLVSLAGSRTCDGKWAQLAAYQRCYECAVAVLVQHWR